MSFSITRNKDPEFWTAVELHVSVNPILYISHFSCVSDGSNTISSCFSKTPCVAAVYTLHIARVHIVDHGE